MDKSAHHKITLSLRSLVILVCINLVVLFGLAVPLLLSPRVQFTNPTIISPTSTQSSTTTNTPFLSFTPTATPSLSPTSAQPLGLTLEHPSPLSQGIMVMAMNDNGYTHLFEYQPQTIPFTRLTNNPWDDITPALSPDRKAIAFSSHQNGYWDLLLLNLTSGSLTRLTDTADYDASPTWSPDGKWLAFETYLQQKTFQISVLSIDNPTTPPILLTNDLFYNHSPAWSPRGREIAFISSRQGRDSLWIADLDKVDGRFKQVSEPGPSQLNHLAWSPDGNQLAWSSSEAGQTVIYLLDLRQPDQTPRVLGSGDWPVWSPDGTLVATRISAPNQEFLAAYQISTGNLSLPPEPLPGPIQGFDWKGGNFPTSLPQTLLNTRSITPTPLWASGLNPVQKTTGVRGVIVPLQDLSAPQAALSDEADKSFQALRQRLSSDIGWDFLSSLENAFVPLTSPLAPGLGNDWLYTGRGIAVNTQTINAGWMVTIREDFGNQTYWRIFLKTRYQDGSQGVPLQTLPWDLNSRSSGNAQVYEDGGASSTSIPSGYWLDFTALAARYGWQRLPSLANWRNFYPGIRLNEFAFTSGLDWQSAMLQLYPPEILVTPTTIYPTQSTPTPVPTWYRTRTPTATSAPSITPTRRPTWTPMP